MKLDPSSRFGGHDVADLLQSADQSVGGLLRIGAIEVGGAEILPFGAVAQHVIGGVLAFRTSYNLLPLALALPAYGLSEAAARRARPVLQPRAGRWIDR